MTLIHSVSQVFITTAELHACNVWHVMNSIDVRLYFSFYQLAKYHENLTVVLQIYKFSLVYVQSAPKVTLVFFAMFSAVTSNALNLLGGHAKKSVTLLLLKVNTLKFYLVHKHHIKTLSCSSKNRQQKLFCSTQCLYFLCAYVKNRKVA